MNVVALLMADSRFPGGGHVHSGGLEEAVARRIVTGDADLPAFLRGRLATAGTLAAAFAAAAAHAAARGADVWARLDAELDARTPSVAQRDSSRAQGAGTLRAGRAMVGAALVPLGRRPHHAVVLGALVGFTGGTPVAAASTAAYLSVSGPASAAIRLLGLDPFVVNASLAALAGPIDAIAGEVARGAGHDPARLPAPGAPALDLFAEAHVRAHTAEVRLFAS